MTDIVERLRHGCSCNFTDTPCGAEEECRAAFDAADEITRLRAEVERLREWNREIALNARELVAENQRLRAALREVMDDLTLIGKNNWLPVGMLDDAIYVNARAALEGK